MFSTKQQIEVRLLQRTTFREKNHLKLRGEISLIICRLVLFQFSIFVRKNQSPPRKLCFEFIGYNCWEFYCVRFFLILSSRKHLVQNGFSKFSLIFLNNSTKQKLLPKLCFATQMLFKNRTTHCFLIRENTFFITTFHQKSIFWSSAAERIKIIFIHKTHPIRFYTQMEIMEIN